MDRSTARWWKRRKTFFRGGGVAETYRGKVLDTGPIAYWPLNELTGATAQCLVNPLQNGTYTGVTLANEVGPNGDLAPLFDGANDYVDIFSATFDAAFNGATGSMAIWCKVYDAATWTDGASRYNFVLAVDGNNNYSLRKDNANNTAQATGKAGGGVASPAHAPFSSTDWFHLALTWSDQANADELKFFVNGTQYGGTSAALGVWAGGALSAVNSAIGAASTVPALAWYGWLAHAVVWDSVLSPAKIAELAVV